MKDKNEKIKKFLKDTVKDLIRKDTTIKRIPPIKIGKPATSSIVLELRRGSPDYKLILAVLCVCDRNIMINSAMFCVEARPGPKSLHEFLFKPQSHSTLFKWLVFFSGMAEFDESAAGMAADLIYHMYGYNCWGTGRSDWSVLSS